MIFMNIRIKKIAPDDIKDVTDISRPWKVAAYLLTSKKQKLSMAISKYLFNCESITFDVKDYLHDLWVHHIDIEVSRNVQKFNGLKIPSVY